jgi:pilus assembly protein Flp/PilA
MSGVVGRRGATMQRLLRFLQDESGPTAVEYAVMLAMIIGTCLAAISIFGSEAGGTWRDTKDKLTTYMNN